MRQFFLKTNRIGFSKWSLQDIGLARSLWGDKAVTKFICAKGEFTAQEVEDRLKLEVENDERFHVQYWPIFDLVTGDFIGCCGLRPFEIENQTYEFGIHLKPEYWGKGIATEAAKAVIDYTFTDLKANNLFAGHHPKNTGSKNLLTKLGFRYIGDHFYAPTQLYHPSYQYR